MAMPYANPFFAQIHLLFALLTRLFSFWTHGKPPKRLVRLMRRAGRALADEIRATLSEDGVAFPPLDDRAFLQWFAKAAPGLGAACSAGFSRPKTCAQKPALPAQALPLWTAGFPTGAVFQTTKQSGEDAGAPKASRQHARAPP
jgi:hypothetical protein